MSSLSTSTPPAARKSRSNFTKPITAMATSGQGIVIKPTTAAGDAHPPLG
jgi:hypothetical protein